MDTLPASVIVSFKSALQKMTGHTRRLYAAELANMYFAGSARKMERAVGVSRGMIVLACRRQKRAFDVLKISVNAAEKKRSQLLQSKCGRGGDCLSQYPGRPLP